MTGAELIAAERQRQIDEEGYSPEHDAGHGDELARAGAAYALSTFGKTMGLALWEGGATTLPVMWPWDPRYWKPTPEDRVRELVKAGALIVAAIDTLLAEADELEPGDDQR